MTNSATYIFTILLKLLQAGATPMLDNDPRDKYLYELMVFTGARKGSGT